jgi:hypothetical protein
MIAYAVGFLAGWLTLIVAGGIGILLSLCLFTWRIWEVLWPRPQLGGDIKIPIHVQ